MGFADTFHYYWVERADPRMVNWTFVRSPYAVPIIIFAYLYFVLGCGPRYMKNRQPYSLKTFIQAYNVFQIASNAAIVYYLIEAGWFTKYWFSCIQLDYSYKDDSYKIAKLMWWTLLLKLFDFVETGVFVLRKKNNQISFLHLYHHISTVLIHWLLSRYIASIMASFVVLVNCSVHVVMYTYYYLSTLGKGVQKRIAPFKPFITVIQMVQFVILLVYCSLSLMPSCDVPKWPAPLFSVNLFINFYLFYDFYNKSYRKDKRSKAN